MKDTGHQAVKVIRCYGSSIVMGLRLIRYDERPCNGPCSQNMRNGEIHMKSVMLIAEELESVQMETKVISQRK